MKEALLMVLIGFMSVTLLALGWAVIGLLIVAKRELPKIQRQINEINGRVVQVLDELVPTLHGATQTLKEAERALHEAAETIENLHIVSDNIRHKLEVADTLGAKVRRLPEKTARALGKVMHQGFKLGGRLLSQQLEKRLQPQRPTIYDGARGSETTHADAHPTHHSTESSLVETALQAHTDTERSQTAIHAPIENSVAHSAERTPNGEATTHKEG
ncbi:MAG: hypothetical protein ACK4ME_09410 [Fimbriimonadales bacterium]